MRISTRLKLISATALLTVMVLIPVLIWSFVEFRNAKQDYALAEAIKINFFERTAYRDQYYLYREDRVLAQWEKSRTDTELLMYQAKAQFQAQDDVLTVDRIYRNITDSASIFNRIVKNNAMLNTVHQGVYAELDKRLFSQLLIKSVEIRNLAIALESSSSRRVELAYQRMLGINAVFAFTMALSVLVWSTQLGRFIRNGLRPLHMGAKTVSDGDLSFRIPISGNDEFSDLAKSINAMTEKLQNFTKRLEEEINSRIRSEEDLRKRETELRVMLENDLVGIATVKDRSILWANPAYEKALGYTKGELNGKPARIIYASDEDYLNLGVKYIPVFKAGKAFHAEHEFVRKDGGKIVVNLSGGILNPETGESLWIFSDITEQKNAEAEMRIAATAFESHEGMTVSDDKGNILRVNHAFTEITGYTAAEVVGKNPRILKSGRHEASFYDAMWKKIIETGSWEGEIWNRRKNGEVYPEHLTITAVKNQAGAVSNYVGTFADITLTKQSADAIKNLAFYDPLTQLPNRRLLMDRLNQALASIARSGRTGAILFIDLDNFKILNDTLGHDVGDLLLQQVAERLEKCVREGDTVARLGGDEFVVVLEDLSSHSREAGTQAEIVGNKILATLNLPYFLAEHEHHNTPSIGVALFNDKTRTIDELMKQADIAMYQAKNDGRNNLRFFDPQMQEIVNVRANLENELHKALKNQQFHLHYQIQMGGIPVNGQHRPYGAEALIRWIHPERGMISPMQFIPLAEETNLILPIGQWVLETACLRLSEWQKTEVTRNLTLSVNVSAKQFRQSDFVAHVQEAIQRHSFNPKLLKLEITESLLLEDIGDTITTMMALNRIGIGFSLDDFGTGYSSLQYLKQLPLQQLKIDQSFVRELDTNPSDKAIVRTIIAMAEIMGLNVIAEGVETIRQLDILSEMGCTYYQGYYFGKPVPIEAFEDALKCFC